MRSTSRSALKGSTLRHRLRWAVARRLDAFLRWLLEEQPDQQDSAAAASYERRNGQRYPLAPARVPLRTRSGRSILHLKDISPHGASGLTDQPLAVGTLVFIQLSKPHFHAARICWVRNAFIGLYFLRPLRPDFVKRLQKMGTKGR